MEQQTYEREIDLIQLIKAMLKKFWIMVAAGVVGAVLLGAYKVVPMVRNLNSPEVLEKQEEKYQDDLEAYEKKLEQFDKEIENLNTSIERQNEYNEKSVKMEMNPFDVQIGTVQYYINTNYQIRPESVYQNPDATKSVLNSYAAMTTNGIMFNYLQDKMKDKMELRYLQELVNVTVDYNNYMITIRVTHKSEEECKELLRLLKNCFTEYKRTVEQYVTSHDMELIAEEIYSSVDLSLEEMQKTNQEKVVNLTESLKTKEEEKEDLKEPKKAESSIGSVVKSGIKYILVGGVLGGFLAAAVIFFFILLDTTIKDEKDVAFYLGLPVLGDIPVIRGEEKSVKEGRKNKKARLSQYEIRS